MVRGLAQTARGVGSSPTQHYSFLCIYMFASKEYSFIYNTDNVIQFFLPVLFIYYLYHLNLLLYNINYKKRSLLNLEIALKTNVQKHYQF